MIELYIIYRLVLYVPRDGALGASGCCRYYS